MCPPRVSLVGSCGAVWSWSREGVTEDKGPLPAPDHVHGNCKGKGWIISFSSLLHFWKPFFSFSPEKSHVLSCWTKVWVCAGCPGDDRSLCPRLCSGGTALWSLGAACASAPRSHWAWAGSSQPLTVSLTFLQCQVPVCASVFPTQGTGQRWQGLLGSDRALWLKSQRHRAGFGKEWFQWQTRLLTSAREPTKE